MNIDDSITDHIIVQPEGSDNDAMKHTNNKYDNNQFLYPQCVEKLVDEWCPSGPEWVVISFNKPGAIVLCNHDINTDELKCGLSTMECS